MLKQTNTRIDSNSRTIRTCVRDTFTKTTETCDPDLSNGLVNVALALRPLGRLSRRLLLGVGHPQSRLHAPLHVVLRLRLVHADERLLQRLNVLRLEAALERLGQRLENLDGIEAPRTEPRRPLLLKALNKKIFKYCNLACFLNYQTLFFLFDSISEYDKII